MAGAAARPIQTRETMSGNEQTKIRILPDALVNLIAAGEIIERPSSVIRELMENSLDAEAGSIDIEMLVGGKRRIVVADDGVGMGAADVRLALERHATSKIAGKQDLGSIHTLGFRGEALGSIASVSRFSLFSRERGADAGTEIAVAGGVVQYVRDSGIPVGTRVIVDDLFYSVPARRKFLKGDRTEYLNGYDVVVKHALSRPDVRFRLTADEKEVINAPAGTLRERAGDVLGRRVAHDLGEVGAEEEGIRVTGLAGRPEESRSTQSGIHLFVNDRPIRDYQLTAAIQRAYSGLIIGGRFPVAVIFIQLPFSEVDVNIHPAKREVKFTDPRLVGGVVYRAVEAAVRRLTKVTISAARPALYESGGDLHPNAEGSIREAIGLWGGRPDRHGGLYGREPGSVPNDRFPRYEEAASSAVTGAADGAVGRDAKILGQVLGTYIVLSDGQGLVIIDQHAAHERVVYERIKAGRSSNAVPRQRLLFPMTLELDGPDRAAVARHLDEINAIGFELEEFGGDTLLVSAVPSIVKDADVKGLIEGIAGEFREETGRPGIEETVDRVIKAVACHGSVRAGRDLSLLEMERLIGEIENAPFAAHCPHGRPTMIRITGQEIERRLRRT
jgi:DNA mismatch repair protein MutL